MAEYKMAVTESKRMRRQEAIVSVEKTSFGEADDGNNIDEDEIEDCKEAKAACFAFRASINDKNCDLMLQSTKIIRKHCQLLRECMPSVLRELEIEHFLLAIFMDPPNEAAEFEMLKTLYRFCWKQPIGRERRKRRCSSPARRQSR